MAEPVQGLGRASEGTRQQDAFDELAAVRSPEARRGRPQQAWVTVESRHTVELGYPGKLPQL